MEKTVKIHIAYFGPPISDPMEDIIGELIEETEEGYHLRVPRCFRLWYGDIFVPKSKFHCVVKKTIILSGTPGEIAAIEAAIANLPTVEEQ